MAKVTGIGGVFIRAKDPKVLTKWYATHLGIPDPQSGTMWHADGGITVVSMFASDSDYYRTDRSHMINLRVDDLAAFTAGLEAAGITVKRLPDEPYGLFAHIEDPEGNPIELWQPIMPDGTGDDAG